jgi:pimeloyl-ACP methyl ester carboxylesterase
MARPLSQLVYTRIQDGSGSPRIITLHQHNHRGGDVREYGIAASPTARIIGLESYKGVYIGRDIVGYTWFIGPMTRPSPIYFGDALAEIERFLWDEIDRQGPGNAELPFLIGVEQGAIMALAAAAAVPDLISGVIAIDGTLPIVPGWTPPLVPLDDLPILLIDPPTPPVSTDGVLAGEALASTLAGWGATVTRRTAPADTLPAASMSAWIAAQPVRHRQPGTAGI